MSVRTEANIKSEAKLAVALVLVLVLITSPFTLSLFRDNVAIALLVKSVPVLLMSLALGCSLWVARKGS